MPVSQLKSHTYRDACRCSAVSHAHSRSHSLSHRPRRTKQTKHTHPLKPVHSRPPASQHWQAQPARQDPGASWRHAAGPSTTARPHSCSQPLPLPAPVPAELHSRSSTTSGEVRGGAVGGLLMRAGAPRGPAAIRARPRGGVRCGPCPSWAKSPVIEGVSEGVWGVRQG